jgi:ectoine hydroxylase-related dioxygenase (phytanoyl-CoA dioxygenase family)
MRFERPAEYVVQPPVEAGDALIFTEALVHGTMPWHGSHERRALLYKFSPGYSAWSQKYPNPEDYENLTEQQRRILSPPSVGNRPDVIA